METRLPSIMEWLLLGIPYLWSGTVVTVRYLGKVVTQRTKTFQAAGLASPAGLEPATHSLEGCCSIHLSYGEMRRKFGRGERIRTSDPLLPKQVRYQTALHPDACGSHSTGAAVRPFQTARAGTAS